MKKLSIVVLALLLISMATYGESMIKVNENSVVFPTGRVGIGIGSPSNELDVLGNIRIRGIDGFDRRGEEAILKLGDGNHYIKSEWGYGVHIGTAGVGNVINIKESNGRVGIGTTTPQSKLAVNGTVTAKDFDATVIGWPDFVFNDNYQLMPLDKLEKHIKKEKSLPGIPTEKEVKENGVKIGEMQAKLLEKVEELTLYVIELKKENEELKKANENLENRISALEK